MANVGFAYIGINHRRRLVFAYGAPMAAEFLRFFAQRAEGEKANFAAAVTTITITITTTLLCTITYYYHYSLRILKFDPLRLNFVTLLPRPLDSDVSLFLKVLLRL